MATLSSKLEAFHPQSESELGNENGTNRIFSQLAESFLYGGYISVKDHQDKERYRIYLHTVEFYCHYDGQDKNSPLPKDPIVYHRNERYVKGEVPYFPLMAFHAHASGLDITFEKESLQLRSSALIRAYEVFDVQQKQFLTYSKNDQKFVACDENEKTRVNGQSTYLYNFLNGFIGDSVKWIDDVRTKEKPFKIGPRKNVFKYEGEKKLTEKDNRKWSFTRTEALPKMILPE